MFTSTTLRHSSVLLPLSQHGDNGGGVTSQLEQGRVAEKLSARRRKLLRAAKASSRAAAVGFALVAAGLYFSYFGVSGSFLSFWSARDKIITIINNNSSSTTNNNTTVSVGTEVDFPLATTLNKSGVLAPSLPLYANRPFYDLVVAVPVVGGDSDDALEEIARVRRVYARYEGGQVVPDGGSAPPLTFRVIFIVGRAGLPEETELAETGLLLGDFFHVDVREGYTHLGDKTGAMVALSEHLR